MGDVMYIVEDSVNEMSIRLWPTTDGLCGARSDMGRITGVVHYRDLEDVVSSFPHARVTAVVRERRGSRPELVRHGSKVLREEKERRGPSVLTV